MVFSLLVPDRNLRAKSGFQFRERGKHMLVEGQPSPPAAHDSRILLGVPVSTRSVSDVGEPTYSSIGQSHGREEPFIASRFTAKYSPFLLKSNPGNSLQISCRLGVLCKHPVIFWPPCLLAWHQHPCEVPVGCSLPLPRTQSPVTLDRGPTGPIIRLTVVGGTAQDPLFKET